MNYKESQIFTPIKYVNMLLDEIGYNNNLYGKKILENSCGNGAILSVIIERYITDLYDNGLSLLEIKQGLENDIYALEIDKEKYDECLMILNKICSEKKIYDVQWHIYNEDSLYYEFKFRFDFIVGNPPYINYRNIDEKNRDKLRKDFSYCSFGKFDYCYAFIERSIKLLGDKGKMAYLIPSSIFKNVSGKNMRKDLLKYDIKIIENFDEIIFDNANVAASVLVVSHNEHSQLVVVDYKEKNTKLINKNDIGDKWIFSTIINNETKFSFSDKYNVGSTIATLANQCFIFKPTRIDNNYYYINEYKIEKNIVKRAYSPKNMFFKKEEYIIYPYYYTDEGFLKKYDKNEFEKNFPECVKYLRSKEEILKRRTSDNNSSWFEYGRSQALKYMNNYKLMISIMITNEVKVYELGINDIPYSGIYITQKTKDYTLEKAKKILKSKEFYGYVNNIGVDSSTKSKRITPDDLKKYKF